MARRRLLSDEQLAPFWAWASDERAIVRQYTLSRADLDLIAKKRTASNQLGFAVLMCGMRFPGRVLDVTETPPAAVLAFIADQVGVPPAQFVTYRQRPTNRREHVAELMAVLGCRAFDTDAYRELLALAVSLAQGTPHAERLVQSVIDEARSRHILLPTRRAIDLLCHRARARSELLLQRALTTGLTDETKNSLDALLKIASTRQCPSATSLEGAVAEFRKAFGRDAVVGALADVTDETAVAAAFRDAVLAYGGVDIVVANAGIASAAPFEDTSLELWNRNIAILATGYFLAAREGYRIMKDSALGGSIVFVASKNALAASPGASAYCTAKAAEVHLARCLALEGAPLGIRANVVNPDAVLRGSKIWQGEWRAQRAASNKVAETELEEVYRQRSLLKRSVYPEDIAEAVYYFASDLSAKSTGNILNVDAGNAVSFTR